MSEQARHAKGTPKSQGGQFRPAMDGVDDGGVTLAAPNPATADTGSLEYAMGRYGYANDVTEQFDGTAVTGSHTDVRYARTTTFPATDDSPKVTLRVEAHVGDPDVRRKPSTAAVDMWTNDGWKRVLNTEVPTEGAITWHEHRDNHGPDGRESALADWNDAVARFASDNLIDALRIVS